MSIFDSIYYNAKDCAYSMLYLYCTIRYAFTSIKYNNKTDIGRNQYAALPNQSSVDTTKAAGNHRRGAV